MLVYLNLEVGRRIIVVPHLDGEIEMIQSTASA